MTSPVDIRPDHLAIVQGILFRHLPAGVKVWVFGSRANWTTKDSSDLDLALECESKLSHKVLGALKDAFEDSALPYTVDVVDLNRIGDSFRQIVESQKVPLSVDGYGNGHTLLNGWRELPFSEAVQINPMVRLERGVVYPFVDMAAVNTDSRSARSATEREFKGSGSRFQSGDTLMARITPCLENGKIARYQAIGDEQQAHGSTEFIVIRGRSGVTDNDFTYYLTQWEEVRNYAIGQMTGTSGRQRVPVDCLHHLEIPLPPLPEQRAIAHILGTLDDKIELNRRLNETLEAMARALFKSWFVDFEPVRAKMEGRDTGLPSDLAALFADRLVDSELGEIPEGWEVKSLGELSTKPQYGYTESAKDEPIGPNFLRITDINKKAWIEWESVPYCEIVEEDYKKYRLHEGDILIARMADPGHGCMIEEERDAVFASYLIRFRPKQKCYARFLQYWLRSDAYWELVKGRGAGTTRVSLNARVLSGFPTLVPADALLGIFGELINGLRSRVVSNAHESRVLGMQRDALLPGLVSGEMGVGEWRTS